MQSQHTLVPLFCSSVKDLLKAKDFINVALHHAFYMQGKYILLGRKNTFLKSYPVVMIPGQGVDQGGHALQL